MLPGNKMTWAELSTTAKLLIQRDARIDASARNVPTVLADVARQHLHWVWLRHGLHCYTKLAVLCTPEPCQAAAQCRVDLMKLLIELGADPKKKDYDGFTALDSVFPQSEGCAGNKSAIENTKDLLQYGNLTSAL